MAGGFAFGIPPDRTYLRRAFVKFTPEISVFVRIDDSKFAPLKSTYGPIMKPPLALLVTNLYGGGRADGGFVFGIPPDRMYRSRAFVKSALDISVFVRMDASRFAPLRSAYGPTM